MDARPGTENAGCALVTNGASGQDREVSREYAALLAEAARLGGEELEKSRGEEWERTPGGNAGVASSRNFFMRAGLASRPFPRLRGISWSITF